MPMILMYLVALALAATVTMWIAPMSLWQGSRPAEEAPHRSPVKVRKPQAVGALHVRHEGFE